MENDISTPNNILEIKFNCLINCESKCNGCITSGEFSK